MPRDLKFALKTALKTADGLTLHRAGFHELTVPELYALLKLRQDVFVVEQKCAFPEIDGRDAEPGVTHLWISEADEPLSYLRVFGGEDVFHAEHSLDAEDGFAGEHSFDGEVGPVRIGRVVTAAHARGRGLSGVLMESALEIVGARSAQLDAQVDTASFYARFGFAVAGPEYLEDNIPHVLMIRSATASC